MNKYNTFRRYWILENEKQFEQAKNFLKKIRWLDNEIDALIENKKSYQDLATKRTSNLNGCGVHGSGCKDQMAEFITKMADIDNEICTKIDRLVDYKNEVSSVIEKIDDKECQKILVLKFARYMPMVDIADAMHMDRSTVYRKYNKAIKAVQQILSESDKAKG